jgi:hypothetical protein
MTVSPPLRKNKTLFRDYFVSPIQIARTNIPRRFCFLLRREGPVSADQPINQPIELSRSGVAPDL